MKTSDFDYELPPERIAQHPVEPRDASQLMVLDRASGEIHHTVFREIGRFLDPGDLLVMNQTRVLAARIIGRKHPGGGRVEILLLRKKSSRSWEVLVGGKGMQAGRRVSFAHGPSGQVQAELSGARRLFRFDEPVEPFLAQMGRTPLPPYIREPLADAERYQTVYATEPGSAAAPTAGLHFTPALLESLRRQGVRQTWVTLHVGLDTFAPVRVQDPSQHRIHSEWCSLPAQTAAAINQARSAGQRVVCVGTTSVRTVESAARGLAVHQPLVPFEGDTDLFILPGYAFKFVDAMVTNFHLPRSTLLMMVSALAGREMILQAYQMARARQYRFYSFGDAMLIL